MVAKNKHVTVTQSFDIGDDQLQKDHFTFRITKHKVILMKLV